MHTCVLCDSDAGGDRLLWSEPTDEHQTDERIVPIFEERLRQMGQWLGSTTPPHGRSITTALHLASVHHNNYHEENV